MEIVYRWISYYVPWMDYNKTPYPLRRPLFYYPHAHVRSEIRENEISYAYTVLSYYIVWRGRNGIHFTVLRGRFPRRWRVTVVHNRWTRSPDLQVPRNQCVYCQWFSWCFVCAYTFIITDERAMADIRRLTYSYCLPYPQWNNPKILGK